MFTSFKGIFLLLQMFFVGAVLAGKDGVMYKKLSGPPTGFVDFKQATPYDAASTSRAQLFPVIELQPLKLHADISFTVDTTDLVVVGMICEKGQQKHLKTTFKGPSGSFMQPSATSEEAVGMNTGDQTPAVSYSFASPATGEWSARVSWSLFGAADNTTGRAGGDEFLTTKVFLVIAFEHSALDIWVSLASPSPLVGAPLTIEAMVPDKVGAAKDGLRRPRALSNTVNSAEMTIVEPDGDTVKETMRDGANGQPDDGIFEGSFKPSEPGVYNVLVDVSGTDSNKLPFRRSLWYLFRVAKHTLSLTNSARASLYTHPVTNDDIVTLDVGVEWDPSSKPTYRGYAEVWGTPSTGSASPMVPVAWVSGVSEVADDNANTDSSGHFMRFELNTKWLDNAGAKPPLQLRNVTFEEIDSFIPMFQGATVPVTTSHPDLLDYQSSSRSHEITYEMRNGFNHYRHHYANSTTPGKIVLVHGYCSGNVPYKTEYFDDYATVQDFKQSRTNQDFAKIILDAAESQGTGNRFSIASHSHGGIASLHLYAYFQSGMDAAIVSGGRVLQSTGTPYHGSPLAGLVASIGGVLGIGCGPNDDLTYDGANRWMALLPVEAQQQVYMYTTQYKEGGLFAACIPLVSVVLDKPNDGVAEVDRTHLPHGNLVSHEQGWCHTVMMLYPPQCQDAARCKDINQHAAR